MSDDTRVEPDWKPATYDELLTSWAECRQKLSALRAERDALRQQVQQLQACVREWIEHGFIVPDEALNDLLKARPR